MCRHKHIQHSELLDFDQHRVKQFDNLQQPFCPRIACRIFASLQPRYWVCSSNCYPLTTPLIPKSWRRPRSQQLPNKFFTPWQTSALPSILCRHGLGNVCSSLRRGELLQINLFLLVSPLGDHPSSTQSRQFFLRPFGLLSLVCVSLTGVPLSNSSPSSKLRLKPTPSEPANKHRERGGTWVRPGASSWQISVLILNHPLISESPTLNTNIPI